MADAAYWGNPLELTEMAERREAGRRRVCGDGVWLASVFVLLLLALGLLAGLLVTSRAAHQSGGMKPQEVDQPGPRHREKRQETCQEDVCVTQECVHVASSILRSMNAEADPCHDFFEYACGGWIRQNDHRTNVEELFYGVMHNLMPERVDITLSELMRTGKGVPKELLKTKPYKDLLLFHQTCLDVGHSSEEEIQRVHELLTEMKEFQVGRPFQAESWDLTKATLEMLKMNGAPLFDVLIDADVRNSSRFSIIISTPRLHGLIPTLMGPRLGSRRHSDLKKFLRSKGRRVLFGDKTEDMLLMEALKEMQPENKGVLSEGDIAHSPNVNVIPNEVLSGKNVEERDIGEKQSTVAPPSTHRSSNVADSTTSRVSTVAPSTSRVPAVPSSSTNYISSIPSTSHVSTDPSSSSSTSHFSYITPHSSTPGTTINDSTTIHTPTTSSVQPGLEANDTQGTEYYDLMSAVDNVLHIPLVSRKDVYQLFKENLEEKRLESISKMMEEYFNNSTIPAHLFVTAALAANMTADNIFSTITQRFIAKLEEIQPDEREELQAEQHATLHNHYSLDQLEREFPIIDWGYLLEELFEKPITEEDNIYVYFPGYLGKLCQLLNNTEPWVIHYSLLALYIHDVLMETVSAPEEIDRRDFCLQACKNTFGEVMSNMYMHSLGNQTIRNLRTHAASILELLREQVRESIHWASWLKPEDKKEALAKLQNLQAEVAAYDNLWNITYINETHAGIEFQSNFTFLDTVLELYRVFRVEMYRLYHKPIDKRSFIWSLTVQPYIVNAFHMQATNTIVFPEAFFQEPYYRFRGPEFVNYGFAATAMAHEIFHGLDFSGTLFNHRGELTRPFSEAVRNRLNATVECYHDLLTHSFYQEVFLEYTMIAMEIDSSATLNENLADIAGIRHSFRAYKRWEELNYEEPRLPALPLNPHQLFFLSAAQPYCAVIPNLAKIFLMEMDEHLPNGIRVNAIMMNTPEFAETFNCSKDSRMVAHQTCHIF